MRIIAVDFDGVIHSFHKGWQDGSLYGGVIEGAVKEINRLQKEGFEIVIFTTRTNFVEILKWLQEKGIFNVEITNIKPKDAIAFIDDRAIRFENNWSSIVKYFI